MALGQSYIRPPSKFNAIQQFFNSYSTVLQQFFNAIQRFFNEIQQIFNVSLKTAADMETINDAMQVRMTLLKETGYNVETAQKCWNFVRGGNEIKKQEPASDRLEDGVYIIDCKGNAVRYDGENTETTNFTSYIGIVQGSHSVAIALQDLIDDEITLTTKESEKDHSGYKDSFMDAVLDWCGKGNTERLKRIGLNPAIQLKDGEYIPTLAELYLICLNQKDINAAMRFVGGQELKGWYWSSTECSATHAWYLCHDDGYAGYGTKATPARKVRPVSEFLHR